MQCCCDGFVIMTSLICCLLFSLEGFGFTDNPTSGSVQSSFVDIYNSTSNRLTAYPKGLRQARSFLAAASLPSGLALFVGGLISGLMNV